jgi:hypothetical protein
MIGLSITTIIILVLVFLLFFKVTKVIWKAILFSFLVILVLFSLLGYFVYTDVQKIINEDKLILVTSGEDILSGMVFSKEFDQAEYLTKEELGTYEALYQSGDYESILEDRYLLVNIKTEMYAGLNETIELINGTTAQIVNKQDALDLLNAETPEQFMEIADKISENITNTDNISNQEMLEYKLKVSAALVNEVIEDTENNGISEVIENTEFYPNRITIVLIREIPGLIARVIPN